MQHRHKIARFFSLILSLIILLNMIGNGNTFAQEVDEPYIGYNQLGSVDSYKKDGYTITVDIHTGEQIRVQFYKDNLVRIYMDPTGEFRENPVPNNQKHDTTPIVHDFDYYKTEGLAVEPTVEDNDGKLTISSNNLVLEIDKTTSKMKLVKGDKVIFEESKALNHKEGSTIQTLLNDKDEYFYGGGTQNGRFSHRGKLIKIVNENSWTDGGVSSPAPFYWSTNGYGVVRNTFKPGQYDFGSSDANVVKTTHNENKMDAFYFVEDNPEGILNEYTDLSGKPAFLPEYAFYPAHLNAYNRDTWVEVSQATSGARLFDDGKYYKEYQPGQYSGADGHKETLNNDDQFSARAVINRYINHDMPLGWFLPNDGYGAGYGQTDTLDGDIENLRLFTEYANERGIETGLWTQSALHPKDPANPQKGERDIEKEIVVAGVRSLKTDVAWVGSGYDFGLDGIDDVYNFQKQNTNTRPNIVTLDGWVGTQRYGSIWTGDQSGGNWEYIRFHLPTYIGTGLSGIPNIGSDMDGIFGGSPLIMTRDTQWKTFTPQELYMDGWGSYQKNPWEHGEPYASINRTYLKLKSQILPYTYSIAKRASETGMPMVRAMFLEFPNEYTYGTATQYQYMYGDSFLVAPVYQNTQMNDETYDDIRNGIYLPENETWIDYFTGKQYEGGQILNEFEAPFWKLPLFVKNGSIIPMYKANNNSNEIDRAFRIFDIYADGHSEFEVFEDDGKTFDYEDGKMATTLITSDQDEENLQIKINKTVGSYDEMVAERATETLINVSEKPETVEAFGNGQAISLTEAKTLEEYENGENVYYYDENVNLNQFATEGSSFADVEIVKNPVFKVKLAKINVKETELQINLTGFVNEDNVEVTDDELPQVPTNFQDSSVSHDTVTLTWDAAENAQTYEIEMEGNIFTNIKDVKKVFDGLKNGTEYTFKIRARNTLGVSDWSEELTITTELNPYRNAIKATKVTIDKEDQGGTPVTNMFDLDPTSAWHTKWGISQVPITVVADLGGIYSLDHLEYIPREDAGNGTITKYAISTSIDGRHWIDGDDLRWERSGSHKFHDFGDLKAKFVKIVIKEAVGGFGSGSEFYILKDDGTKMEVLGDTNNNGSTNEADLTFFENYSGLKTVDSDWKGYVENYDYNMNGVIDAYDINLVQALSVERTIGDEEKVAGQMFITADKTSVKAGETLRLTIRGRGLRDVNALSAEIPLDKTNFKLVGISTTELTANMDSYSKERTHTDGNTDIYVMFGNTGKNPINQDGDLAVIELQALKDNTVDINMTLAQLVDTNLCYIDALTENPITPGDEVYRVPVGEITVSGDESAYETEYGSPLENVNDGDRGTLAELKWNFEPNWDENGNLPENVKLPQTITLAPQGDREVLNKVIVVKRANGNGSIKNITVNVYNGEEVVFTKDHKFNVDDTLVEILTGDIDYTKVEVIIKDTYDQTNNMMSIAEIELYEKLIVEEVDKEQLGMAIEVAQSILDQIPDQLPEELLESLQEKLNKAQEVYNNDKVTQDQVDEAYEELLAVLEEVGELIDPEKPVNKEELNQTLDLMTSLIEDIRDKFTDESLEAFDAEVENANNILEKEDATQAEVDKALAKLNEAYKNLQLKEEETPEVNTSVLESFIEKLNTKLEEIKDKLTDESKANLEKAIKEATDLLASEDLTQDKVDDEILKLADAITSIQQKEEIEQPTVDTSALRLLIDKSNARLEEDLEDESRQVLENALAKANEIIEKEDLTAEECNKVYSELVDALLNSKVKAEEPEQPDPEQPEEPKLHDAKGFITGTTNVRVEPNGEIIGTLETGALVNGQYEEGSNWVKFDYYGKEAYVFKPLLSDTIAAIGFASGTTNIRKTPNGEIVGTVKFGEVVEGVVSVDNLNWIKTDVGYIYKALVADSVKVKGLVIGSTNVRHTPNGQIIGSLSKAQYVEGKVTINNPNWIRIKYNNTDAYIYRSLLEDTVLVKSVVTDTVNVRQTPNGKILGTLKKGVSVNGKVSTRYPNWVEIKYKGQTAYVYKMYVK